MLPLYEFMLHYVRRGLQNPAVKKQLVGNQFYHNIISRLERL